MFNLLQVWILHVFALLSWTHGKPLDQSRPNLLYIMTDQQRFDAIRRTQEELAAYNGKIKVKTPNLDDLSKRGAYFKNAYCQCPVCGPARTTLRTGCTIERTGVQTNNLVLEDVYKKMDVFKKKVENQTGIDQILVEDYGYESEYYGKWHIPDRLTQKRSSSAEKVIKFNDYDYKTDMFSFNPNTSWARMFRQYLKYFENNGNISKKFRNKEQEDQYSEYPYTPIRLDSRYGYPMRTNFTKKEFTSFASGQASIKGNYSLPIEYTPTYINGQVALNALDRLAKQTNPFLLTVSLHAPHPPMIPASKHLEYYLNNRHDLFVPPSINDDMTNNAYYKKGLFNELRDLGYSDEEKVKEWIALYYALIQEIDDEVGKLVRKLDDHNIAQNTMIVFTSDHGEMLGAHGMRGKNVFFEESVKVPLFLVFPGHIKQQTVVNEPVSHLDLVGTILDYLGAGEADNSDGTSLRRFIEKTSYNQYYDESVIVSEWDFSQPINGKKLSQMELDKKPAFLVRKGPYKLMMFKDASSGSEKKDIMFDIENDPFEMNNLLGNKGMNASDEIIGKAEHLRCLLIDWMQRMDGDENGYYSNPVHNAYVGQGDIAEIRMRLEWRATDIWIGDQKLQFGSAVWDGSNYVRNEYLYLGRTNEGTLHISNINVGGEDASYFHLDKSEAMITAGEYVRVKVSYETPLFSRPYDTIDAYVKVDHNASLDTIKVPIEFALDSLPPVQYPSEPPNTSNPSVTPTPPTMHTQAPVSSVPPILEPSASFPSSGPPPNIGPSNVTRVPTVAVADDAFTIASVSGIKITLNGVTFESRAKQQQVHGNSTRQLEDDDNGPFDKATIELWKVWEAKTEEYVRMFYVDNSDGWSIDNVITDIQVTNQELTETDSSVRLTFDQVLSYYVTSETTIVMAEDLVIAPFSTEERRENYVRLLKAKATANNEAFRHLTSVSPIEIDSSVGDDDGGGGTFLSAGVIVGVLLFVVGLLLFVGVAFLKHDPRKQALNFQKQQEVNQAFTSSDEDGEEDNLSGVVLSEKATMPLQNDDESCNNDVKDGNNTERFEQHGLSWQTKFLNDVFNITSKKQLLDLYENQDQFPLKLITQRLREWLSDNNIQFDNNEDLGFVSEIAILACEKAIVGVFT